MSAPAATTAPGVTRLVRPNGRIYRPRKVVGYAWENPDDLSSDFISGVIVLGTHDVERARTLACSLGRYWFGLDHAIRPHVGWFRDGFEYGVRCWVDDPVTGRAGVMFTASEYPDETTDEQSPAQGAP